ncbi:MAG: hypothetical protein ACRDP4_04495, partial [Nocardioidaceae bacterium]
MAGVCMRFVVVVVMAAATGTCLAPTGGDPPSTFWGLALPPQPWADVLSAAATVAMAVVVLAAAHARARTRARRQRPAASR